MLTDERIGMVVRGVEGCRRQLIVDGTFVVLDHKPTASPAVSNPAGQDEAKETSPPQPALVRLHMIGGQVPEMPEFRNQGLIDLMYDVDQAFRPGNRFNPEVPAFCLVRNEDSEPAEQRPPVVDLVVWSPWKRLLELQVDGNFTEPKVTNALAREIALNAAKAKLVEYLHLVCGEGDLADRDSPFFGDGGNPLRDPEVVQFTARLKSSIGSLMADARLNGAAYSISPPPFSDRMEDVLRECFATRRRREAREEHPRSPPAKRAAHAAAVAATASSGGAPPPTLNENMPSNRTPSSADELAASPPLVLRPFEDIYRGFSDVEIMNVFKKVVLSRNDCCLCPGYEIWFEEKEGGSKHEYQMKAGSPYC